MRVLVTGGMGYVGSVLVAQLRAAGHTPVIFDVRVPQDEPRSALRGDVRDVKAVARAVSDVDAVVHLAAVVGYPACARNPLEAEGVNVGGTEALARACAGRVPWVYLSTASVYGGLESVANEDATIAPRSVYAKTKAKAEAAALVAGAVCFRPVTAYGLSPAMRWDLLVHQMVRDACDRGAISVFEPEAVRGFISVDDLARACQFGLLQTTHLAGRVWNVGDPSLVFPKQVLAEQVARRTGARVVLVPGEDLEARRAPVSLDRFIAAGFTTESSWTQTLQAVVNQTYPDARGAAAELGGSAHKLLRLVPPYSS